MGYAKRNDSSVHWSPKANKEVTSPPLMPEAPHLDPATPDKKPENWIES